MNTSLDHAERASLAWRALEESNDAILITSPDHRICEANPFTQRMTGFSRSELLRRSLFDLFQAHGNRSIAEVLQALDTTGTFHSRESFQIARRDADPLEVSLSISRVHSGGRALGLVIARDVSARVAAARELQAAHDSLEQRVTERTAELLAVNQHLADEITRRKRSQDELERVNRRLTDALEQIRRAQAEAARQEQLRIAGRLASGIAHDVNNALAPLLDSAEVLLASTSLDPPQQVLVDRMRICGEDIRSIVRRLDGLRPAAETLRRCEIRVAGLLRDVVDLTRPRRSERPDSPDGTSHELGSRLGLSVDVDESLVVLADESAMRTALANLILNSIDAIPERGQITLAAEARHGEILISVVDDGEGMTPERLRTCREPFVSTRTHGAGLGLSLVQQTVEQHGGRLEIESSPGSGTTVRILLPRHDVDTSSGLASAPASPPSPASHSPSEDPVDDDDVARRLHVLLVEDEPLVRDCALALFRSRAIEIDAASNGPEALALLERGIYNVVVADYGLPGGNGLDLLETCRKRQPGIRTVLVTGWLDPAEGPHEAADLLLQKPYRVDDLLARLSQLEIREPPSGAP